ncbi:MAG: nuclear transport factor 2 family protein [Nitrospira sp.]|nr:nuclear transport factor 2 family protein [Nitrospira sp.]
MSKPRLLWLVISSCCLSVAGSIFAQQSDPDALAAQAAVRSFHEALRRGDVQAVQELLATDAVILEGGHLESRQEYLRHHLSADIEFAKAVPSKVTKSETTVSGQTAWVHSVTVSQGKFHNRKIKLSGAELVVLTRTASGWEIRAVHWSSDESM